MAMNTIHLDRPEFLKPSPDFGPFKEDHHEIRRQAEAIEQQIRIERGILLRLPTLFQREQQLRVDALVEMHQQAKDYAYKLYKQERGQ